MRRDLDQLERSGAIRRVHGGAVSVESRLEEPVFDDKTSLAAREKRRIAEAALTFVEPGDTIYLDGGSTVLELARLLRERTNLTVVTNSLHAALELAGRGPRLIVIGGELRRLSQTMVGPLTRLVLHELHLDKAFMGTIGFTLNEGLTTTDPSEAYTKEAGHGPGAAGDPAGRQQQGGQGLVRPRRPLGQRPRADHRQAVGQNFAKELIKKESRSCGPKTERHTGMKKSPTYLSDSRPKFTPFEIDCGKIPAYRYKGNLAVRTQSQDDHTPPRRSRSWKTC